ncbi:MULTISPECIES: hypothetical protein [unclassified Micromonospora]|uniref:hypothetical protein n=1 Tax=unclassified Micromonospora TaxID=2617518 RepID=UPI0018902F8D|nr:MULTISPECIES: hypothetical protein [unclassified Micromonospora]MBF5028436.1 hypothetical protein [Micromonospora sp. ANENR4]WBC03769.1 hypothetical protein O7546_01970 [Micromonospora sp. WMMA1976]
MPSELRSWTIKHFSQANPVGPGQDSVPALLRRIADSIGQRPGIEVQDVPRAVTVTHPVAAPKAREGTEARLGLRSDLL